MRQLLAFLVVALLSGLPAAAEAKDATSDAVVKVYATARAPEFSRPWTKSAAQESSGSGVILDGKRILTNAHVVQYATQLFVQANQSAEKVPASVLAIAPDIDLALIRPDNETFFEGRPSLAVADGLAGVRDTVSVYGYPLGGEQISVTQGIISRIEYVNFYGMASGLRIQIDAAINPGNSGGPAVAEGRIAGLVFSKVSQAENIGYLIAAEEIRRFLEDVKDGSYDGKPYLFDDFQTTENDALRAKLCLAADVGGVMVTRPARDQADYPLKTWDVVVRIGDKPLDRQGRIAVRDDLRLAFQYLVPSLAAGGKVKLGILRDNKPLEVDVPVRNEPDLLVPFLKGKYPRYFVCGPMVVSTPCQDALLRLPSSVQTYLSMSKNPLIGRLFDRPAFEGEELVILASPLLPHRISRGYGHSTFAVISQIDGVPVRNLAHAAELFQKDAGPYVTIGLAGKYETLVFARKELLAATDDVLADEGIRNPCSEDLRGAWRGGSQP